MANVDVAYGFVPYKNLYGGHAFQTIECVAGSGYGTALFVGDAVIMAAAGDSSGRPGITQAVGTEGIASTNIFGVIVGIQASGPDNLVTHAGAASTTRICEVVPALPGYAFRCNCSTSANPNDIGAMFDIVVGSGSATSGRSAMELNTTTPTTSATATLLGFVNRPDNAIPAAGTDAAGLDAIIVFHETMWITGAGIDT